MVSIFDSTGIASYVIRKDNGLYINLGQEGHNFSLEKNENDIIDITLDNENEQLLITPKAVGSHEFKLNFTNNSEQLATGTVKIKVVDISDTSDTDLLELKLQDQSGNDISLPLKLERLEERTVTIRTKLTDCEVISKSEGISVILVSTANDGDYTVLTVKITALKSGIKNAIVTIKGNREIITSEEVQ